MFYVLISNFDIDILHAYLSTYNQNTHVATGLRSVEGDEKKKGRNCKL